MNIQKWSAGFLRLLAVSMTGGALAAAVGTTTAYQTNIVRNNAGTIGVGADIFSWRPPEEQFHRPWHDRLRR
ncbi:MAG: hypothetical protein R3D43_04935 [Tepidamorphaceae bacterium]